MINHMGTLDEKEIKQEELNRKISVHKGITEVSEAKNTPNEWHRDICQGIVMAYFLVMTVIYPFYAPGGYVRIGQVKYEFFRNISLVTLVVLAAVITLSIVVRRDREWLIRNYRRLSVTDWFAYGYFVAVMLSYLCSPYKKDALWGAEGWYMGVITQMTFVFLYFFFSRYYHCDSKWIGVWLIASVGVFALGICNRFSVYPIMMEGQTAGFISTLGNINWFCGYWSVTAPIGIMLYWCSDKIWVRLLAAFCSLIAMLSGITQGSNSAYLVFIILLLTLLVLSLGSSNKMYRFLELCILFAASCLLGKLMKLIPGVQYNYPPTGEDVLSRVTDALLNGYAALWIMLIVLICYMLFRVLERQGIIHIGNDIYKHRRIRTITLAAIAVAGCITVLVLSMMNGARYSGETLSMSEGRDDFWQVFNEDWGNGRGAAWNCGINAYRSMDTLHKIVGIGPDCFADYVYDVPELAQRLTDQFVNQRLTNAHNELLTLLINTGMLGLVCYTGLFVTAFVRYMRRASEKSFLYVCAVSILAYTVHNMVSFQQVLNTPFVFIVMGIGERFCQNMAEKKNSCDRIEDVETNKDLAAGSGLEAEGQLIEYLLTAAAVMLCLALAFYAKDGYHQIGNAKFAAYRNIMVIGSIILLTALVPYTVLWLDEHRKLKLSVTDGCVLAYLLLSGIAAVSGGFYKDAVWGYTGWNMGFMAQLSFVLLYLFLSRFGRYYRLIIAVLCAAACGVYMIGVLHRLSIDPIGFYDGLTNMEKAQFLSTLGQASWYGSFLAVTLPVGIGVFLYTGKKVWWILSGIFVAIGFCTLVTQNSDSAYFGLCGALVVFFMICAADCERMCRFMGMLTLLFATGKIMYILMRIQPNPEFEADFVTGLMWTSGVTWILMAVCLLATVWLYVMGRRTDSPEYPAALMRRICRVTPAAAVAVIVGVILMIILQTRGALPIIVSDRLADISYFNWNSEWGSGRGRIWSFSIKMFAQADIGHKLFGVGPDCFHSYVAACYNEEQTLYWGSKQLTNAHNEWMTSLINVGIFGTVSYIGIYVTAVRRFYRRYQHNLLLAGIAASCVSYMCYNFFCYQQVLCTPFIFLLMGIGEYILRTADQGKSSQMEVDKS